MLADGSTVSGRRYIVAVEGGAPVTRERDPKSPEVNRIPHGTIVVCAQVESSGGGDARMRISSPAGWVDPACLRAAAAVEKVKLDYGTFLERHELICPGDHYGLEFPFTIAMLQEQGAAFLTHAFQASGAISRDNSVTQIVSVEPLGMVGASENAFLTVAYERDEPGLQTELFIKFPPENIERKFGLAPLSKSEIEMLRFSRRGTVPVPMARYYFGDHSAWTHNYILITDRIGFGKGPIERAYRKGYDHLVPELDEHYRVLAQSLARLAAAQKTGAMGYDVEELFPFAAAARDFQPVTEPERKVDRLIDFIGRVAPHLFTPRTTDPAFLEQWRADLLFGLQHKDTVISWLHENVDYVAFCHANLNLDNAWFWREVTGELRAGLIDWGNAGQLSIGQALSGMLMMLPPERYREIVGNTLSTFLSEYERHGGLALDWNILLFHYKASLYSTALWTIVDMLADMLGSFSDEDYRGMRDWKDERLQSSSMSVIIIWIDNILQEWLDELTPGAACRSIVTQVQQRNALEGAVAGEG